MQEKYRKVFGGQFGEEVLEDILRICHFGCTLDPENPTQVAEYNVGVVILAKMGIFGQGGAQKVVRALCSIIPEKEDEEDEENVGSLWHGLGGGDAG